MNTLNTENQPTYDELSHMSKDSSELEVIQVIECAVCLEELQGSLEITTTCCAQRIHSKCVNQMIDFYDSIKRDTPCPLCRTIISRYIAIDIPENPDTPNTQQRPSANNSSRNWVYCLSFTVFFNMMILYSLRISH